MAKFELGDTVILVNSEEKGIINKVFPPARGRQIYGVMINQDSKKCLESNLIPDTNLTDPFERMKRGIFGSILDFFKINTSFKIQNTSNNTISTLKASNTLFKAYQFKPLLKFLISENRRILVADEVGLGKTIEAGHIMLELHARRELKNALIICPKSLQEKWQTELKEKFNFRFKIYETSKEFEKDLKEHGSRIRAILTYEKVRLPKDNQEEGKKKTSNIFDLIEETSLGFDFILCDEAHRLRNRSTLAFKGVQQIAKVSKAVVLLTATPIMISEQNLFNLLHLLDEEKYSEYSSFLNELAVNAPFVRALNQLNNQVSLQQIAKDLQETQIELQHTSGELFLVQWKRTILAEELFQDIPLYQRIIEELTTKKDTAATRVQLQFDLSDMSELNKLFSRTRKKDVTQDWSQAVREPQTLIVELYPEERREFDKVIEEYIEEKQSEDFYGNLTMPQGATLGLIQKKRQVASSVYGYLSQKPSKNIEHLITKKDAKYEKLLEIIDRVVVTENKKLIVFALFKNTLNYLNSRLNYAGISTAMIHGGVKDRMEKIDSFKNNKDIQILLSSEVGSEGLDLQFCDSLVNYDIPWNPMVVEQRIGRIDRFGQKSPIVNIYNLIVKNSIQEDIYVRLLERIGIFRGCIGDLEAILDKDLDKKGNIGVRNIREWFSSLEKELYCKNISEDQRKKKIDDIEKAILTEQKNLEEISEGLTDTLTNDIYFKNEIANIQKNNRYVAEIELVNYVKTLITTHLTTCQLVLIDADQLIYRFIIPKSKPKLLINFLTEYFPEDQENQNAFAWFNQSIRDKTEIEITFSQEAGYNNRNLMRINAYHPIVIAAMHLFNKTDNQNNNTFKFDLDINPISDTNISKGEYFIAVYKSVMIQKSFGQEQKTELQVPIIYNVQKEKVLEDRNISERLMGEAQLNAKPTSDKTKADSGLLDELLYVFTEEIQEIESKILKEKRMRLDSHKKLQIQRKSEYYENRIENQERIIQNQEFNLYNSFDENERKKNARILPAQKKVLQNLIEEKEQALAVINDFNIKTLSPQLLTLNHLMIS